MYFDPFATFIKKYDRFILTTHETPDGDAIGSEYAMLKALHKIGKKALAFNADPTPGNFMFIDETQELRVLENKTQLPKDLRKYALIILDVNDIHNIGQVRDLVLPKVREYIIIDHHEYEDDVLSQNIIEKNASSTGEILFQVFKELDIPIDLPIAQALYTAIVYDTGSFIYPKTTALTFEIARDLVAIGVKPNEIYTKVYECKTVSFLNLQSKVFSTLEFAFNNHVAILSMTKEIIMESGSTYEEGQQLINNPLNAKDVRVSIFFKENLEGLLRCSMRSKGNIDVARIASLYEGGGHKTAAGFKCHKSLEETKKELLDHLRIYFESEQ